jgi:glucan biosynthesis protein C
MERHYGLDWLRIGAFALLIFYHIGMVFVPWGFHVKTAQPMDWVAIPMMAANTWRLLLLFVVSGYASRALLTKGSGFGAFMRSRSARLLIPLAFGMIVIVPTQPWIDLSTQHGYGAGFWTFFTHDYFGFRAIDGIALPTWQHLWFVAYLWLYTMILALGGVLLGRNSLQAAFDRLFGGAWLWILPTIWLIIVSAWLFPGGRETHALFGDWVAHASYFPAFLFGFAFAGSRGGFVAVARWWRWAAASAIIAYAVAVAIEWAWPVDVPTPYPYGLIFSAARAVQGWATIIALIGIADRYWNRDAPWRATLTEAVFPFYIIHQTVIVGVEWLLLPYGLSPLAEFAILVATTIGGCWAFYLIGREIGWLRPLIGLRRRGPVHPPATATLAAAEA